MRQRSSEQYKQAILKKLASSTLSDRQFALEEGIAHSTLHKWKSCNRIGPTVKGSSETTASDDWSAQEKFAVVLECASLCEIELGEYCRRKGIYPEQVETWKHACLQANMKNSDQKKKADAESKADKKRIKELERELARKEKALAEAAALLVLRKKLDALWIENEDD